MNFTIAIPVELILLVVFIIILIRKWYNSSVDDRGDFPLYFNIENHPLHYVGGKGTIKRRVGSNKLEEIGVSNYSGNKIHMENGGFYIKSQVDNAMFDLNKKIRDLTKQNKILEETMKEITHEKI